MIGAGLHLRQVQSFHYHIARLATGNSVMLDEIRTFVVLAESGSLQRAAQRLFLTPSAGTREIPRLPAAPKKPPPQRPGETAPSKRAGPAGGRGGRHKARR